MSETKWSPGPWKVVEEHDRFVIQTEDGRTVVPVYRAPEGTRRRERDRFDAHLIAAAPDLYEALEMLVNDVGFSCGHEAYQAARAALARARGEADHG